MDSLTLLYDCKTKVLQRFFIAKNNKRKHRFLHVPRFIEGFLTRHTQLPDMLRLGLILTSLTFILFYYIYLPNRKRHGITKA